MKLPHTFTAVDPVSGRKSLYKKDLEHEDFFRHWFEDICYGSYVNAAQVRALIEYGRQIGRDEMYKEMQNPKILAEEEREAQR